MLHWPWRFVLRLTTSSNSFLNKRGSLIFRYSFQEFRSFSAYFWQACSFIERGQYYNQKFVRAFVKKYRVVQFFLILALSVAHNAMAQFSTGTWRDHLPYGNVIDVCYDEINMVYAATPYAIVSYNPATFEVERWSKVNRLSDVGISAVEYDAHSDAVIVG